MSLKSRITLLSVLTTLAVAGLLVAVALVMQSRMTDRMADAVLKGNGLIWQQLVQDEQGHIAKGIEAFNKEFELRTAIRKKDADEVRKYADRYVNLTGDGDRYAALQIFDAAGSGLYSSDRTLNLQGVDTLLAPVFKAGETAQGLIAGEDGRVFAAVAFPVKSRRKITGAAMYIKGLETVLTRLAERGGFGVALADLEMQASVEVAFPDAEDLGRFIDPAASGRVDELRVGERRFVVSGQPILDVQSNTVAYLLAARDDTEQLADMESLTVMATGLVSLCIVGCVVMLFFVLRHYLAPIQHSAEVASRIADGDLTEDPEARGVAEMGVLEMSMRDMIQRLRGMVGEIAKVSSEIRESATAMDDAVSATHADMGDETAKVEGISSALTQMAASIDEVVRLTENTAATGHAIEQDAKQGHQLLNRAGDETQRLVTDIDGVGQAIEGLNKHVEAVTGIVKVIKSIAEQTNLLALNAAIEAARAGEQGRGFAVVADEVRGLASRTQTSTKEIESIIDRLEEGAAGAVERIRVTREQVHGNAAQTSDVLQRFEQIQSSISELVAMGQSAASAVEEQSAVAREVSDGMVGIRVAVERTGDRSNELLRTSRSLKALSGTLEEITGKFRHRR